MGLRLIEVDLKSHNKCSTLLLIKLIMSTFLTFKFNIEFRILIVRTINRKINDTPQRCLLAHFEATLYFRHSEFTFTLSHNNISYYVQVNLLRLKSSVITSKWARNTFGGTIYFAVNSRYIVH